jgi:hypothetical protein
VHRRAVDASRLGVRTRRSPFATDDHLVISRRLLGSVVAARSGDKGGNANVGLWTDTTERWDWLRSHLTVDRFAQLVPEAAGLSVRRHEFPNLKALNFVIVGFLGDGVASCTKTDPQAKALGEYIRALHTDIPDQLVS